MDLSIVVDLLWLCLGNEVVLIFWYLILNYHWNINLFFLFDLILGHELGLVGIFGNRNFSYHFWI